MKRVVLFFALVLLAVSAPVFGQEAAAGGAAAIPVWKFLAAALAVGLSCIAGGIAVGQIGAAAMGAMSENPELSGKALPYAGLAEGICLWGFLVAVLILFS
ncbi:MAG: V/A type ATP synthase; V/A-type H+/Na+-transporting ATPase subunit K [Treponematales bacterium]